MHHIKNLQCKTYVLFCLQTQTDLHNSIHFIIGLNHMYLSLVREKNQRFGLVWQKNLSLVQQKKSWFGHFLIRTAGSFMDHSCEWVKTPLHCTGDKSVGNYYSAVRKCQIE